jgi:hypothetical protein
MYSVQSLIIYNGINVLCDDIKIHKYVYYLKLIYNVLNDNGGDIKMNFKEIRCDFADLVNLDQVRASCRLLLILLRVHTLLGYATIDRTVFSMRSAPSSI